MQMKENFLISIDGLKQHKLRSSLTMLGIIFGVAAVIAMLSIGEGAKKEALEKFKVLGVNNVIVREKALTDTEIEEVRAKFSKGLSLSDADAVMEIVPTLEEVAPQAEIETEAKYEDNSSKITLVGITSTFSSILNYETKLGSFLNEEHHKKELRVCVLGSETAKSLFPVEDPIGKKVKIDDQWFEVIGTLGSKALFTETVGELAARNLNNDIYIPLSSMLRRFNKENQFASQIDQLTIKVSESEDLVETASIIRRILSRRHHNNDDFDIVIPYELLKQEERERQIYNMVLSSIAAISLLVGGIGIMNIMLASVLERTREIGIRRAVGAKSKEILYQFMFESVELSLIGGFAGVILGVMMSRFVSGFAEFVTVITPISIVLAFGISAVVGIVFGTFPARRAASISPIDALRYE